MRFCGMQHVCYTIVKRIYIVLHTVEYIYFFWEENTWTIYPCYFTSINLDIKLLFYIIHFSRIFFSFLRNLMYLLQFLLALLFMYPTLFSTSSKGKNRNGPISYLPTNSNYNTVFLELLCKVARNSSWDNGKGGC